MATTEDQLRTQLGIPPTTTAQQVIILASTSHLDWDWLNTFYGYYSTTQTFDFTDYAVRDIFTNATTYLNANKNNAGQTCTTSNPAQPPPYYYSIAEVGYLQEFASDQAATFKTLQGVGDLLRIVGGGITSPDNLLPNGETLLRNFLIANAWLLSNFPAPNGLPPLPPLQQVWTPDDFGHDSQFPILMEAMGLQGVGFSRIPGDPQQYWTFGQSNHGISGQPDVAAWLLVFGDSNKQHLGTDFIWQASDGSTTLAHFMQAGYFQGASISGPADIQTYYDTNKGASVTPYIFVPVGVDFSLPVPDLVQYACQWNAANLATTGVYAVAATFDHYIQLVSFHQDKLLTRSSKPDMSTTFPFVPTPYWTGCYASRPEIKIRHQKATRLLLGAEIFSVIANFLSVPVDIPEGSIAAGWQQLTPSTHHDYITGTAANSVYNGEQLHLLADAITLGDSALTPLQQDIAAQVNISLGTDQIAVTVFNQLGFARGGLVEMEPKSGFTPVAFGNATNGILGPVQISNDGKWLFCIPTDAASIVPALGYNTFYLTSDTTVNVPRYNPPAAAPNTGSLSNPFLSATFTDEAGWGIATLDALVAGATSQVLQGPANQVMLLNESPNQTTVGNMYKFATEYGTALNTEPPSFTASSVEVLENGPVRAGIRVVGTYSGDSQPFTREYFAVVDEPFLRMKTTGAAPNPNSMFVSFPLSSPSSSAGDIDTMIHGTPYHWDTKPSQPLVNNHEGWVPPIFAATHDFVILSSSSGNFLGAIYHAHLPAWAITGDNKSLIGCLLRNPTNDKNTPPEAGDPDSHTVEYAFRVPQGLSDPTSAMPQCESLSYSTPLVAYVAGSNSEGKLGAKFSMASLSESIAFITAMKTGTVPGPSLGQMIIRVYQPTLSGQQLTLTMPPGPAGQQWQAYGITALETALSADKVTTLNVSVSGDEISFFAERAITTLAVTLTAQ